MAGQQAVDAIPGGHPDRAGHLANLGAALDARFDRSGDIADLDAAVRAARQAADATPAGHPDRAAILSNLCLALVTRYSRCRASGDLDEAIRAGMDAAEVAADGHPGSALYLSNLADALSARSALTGERGDLDAAMAVWRRAGSTVTAPALQRLRAARRLAIEARHARLFPAATEGYRQAVGLLPAVAWHGLRRFAQEAHLSRWAGLAADAASCAIESDAAGLAVELAEQGRSVMWSQATQLHGDLTPLHRADPRLAERLGEIRAALAADPSAITPVGLPPSGVRPWWFLRDRSG